MSSINHFKQNRPVHLARRDAYFEAAVDALKKGGASVECGTGRGVLYGDIVFAAGGTIACAV